DAVSVGQRRAETRPVIPNIGDTVALPSVILTLRLDLTAGIPKGFEAFLASLLEGRLRETMALFIPGRPNPLCKVVLVLPLLFFSTALIKVGGASYVLAFVRLTTDARVLRRRSSKECTVRGARGVRRPPLVAELGNAVCCLWLCFDAVGHVLALVFLFVH